MRVGVKDKGKDGGWAVYLINTGPLSLVPGLGRTIMESGHTEASAKSLAKRWNATEATKPAGKREHYKAGQE